VEHFLAPVSGDQAGLNRSFPEPRSEKERPRQAGSAGSIRIVTRLARISGTGPVGAVHMTGRPRGRPSPGVGGSAGECGATPGSVLSVGHRLPGQFAPCVPRDAYNRVSTSGASSRSEVRFRPCNASPSRMCHDGLVDGSSLLRAALVLLASASVACGKGGLPCTSSAAAYCASTPEAVCNWSLYTAPSFMCRETWLKDSCDPPYNEASQPDFDSNLIHFSYYDRTTGQLVAVLSQLIDGPAVGASSLSCVAGPDSLSRPSCPGNSTVAPCYDGGVL
jgi:hypothetical protein